jgi:hypothetical protein
VRLSAIITAIIGITLSAAAFAGRDVASQYPVDKTIEAKRIAAQQAAGTSGPEGRAGSVPAPQGKPGVVCYPQPHPRAPVVVGC